jgi:hypothetical protein
MISMPAMFRAKAIVPVAVPDMKGDGKDGKPVPDIANHDPKEEREEDREDGRGIDLPVFRQGDKAHDDLEGFAHHAGLS